MKNFKMHNWLKKLPEHYIIKNLSINDPAGIIKIEILINDELKKLLDLKKRLSCLNGTETDLNRKRHNQ